MKAITKSILMLGFVLSLAACRSGTQTLKEATIQLPNLGNIFAKIGNAITIPDLQSESEDIYVQAGNSLDHADLDKHHAYCVMHMDRLNWDIPQLRTAFTLSNTEVSFHISNVGGYQTVMYVDLPVANAKDSANKQLTNRVTLNFALSCFSSPESGARNITDEIKLQDLESIFEIKNVSETWISL